VILIVCALPAELRGFPPREGVDILPCGVGPVEAAVAVARALAGHAYAAVINAGIAGAFRGSAAVGDALLVTSERLADLGLEGGGALKLPDGASLVGEVAADAGLVARTAPLPFRAARGLTVSQVTTTDATAARLQRAYAPDVESMEGFAVLRPAFRRSRCAASPTTSASAPTRSGIFAPERRPPSTHSKQSSRA
jgi:futalosine hydrolase